MSRAAAPRRAALGAVIVAHAALALAGCGEPSATAEPSTPVEPSSASAPALTAAPLDQTPPAAAGEVSADGISEADGVIRFTLGDAAVLVAATCDDGAPLKRCGAARVSVEGTSRPARTVEVEALLLRTPPAAYRGPLGKASDAAGRSVLMADFSGDGREDLALWTGLLGGYGSASYTVFLASADGFRRDEALSALTHGALGLFTVDAGQLVRSSRSGCCLHSTERYELRDGAPVLVEERLEDSSGGSATPRVTVRRLVDGRLQEVAAPDVTPSAAEVGAGAATAAPKPMLLEALEAFARGDAAPAGESGLTVTVPGARRGDAALPAGATLTRSGQGEAARLDLDLEGAYPDAAELVAAMLGPGASLRPASVDCPSDDDGVTTPKTQHYELAASGTTTLLKHTSEDYRRGSTRLSFFRAWPAGEAERCH